MAMPSDFLSQSVLNSPCEYRSRDCVLEGVNQPTNQVVDRRRDASDITPIAKPRQQVGVSEQASLIVDEGRVVSAEEQEYEPSSTMNVARQDVHRWREVPESRRAVTPEPARLLKHWRSHEFSGL